MTETKLRGVSHVPRCVSNPWKAQATLGGITYHLGVFASRKEAAEAYDNLAYWAGLDGFKTGGLNYPSNYQGESSPPPTEVTQRVQRKHRAIVADKRALNCDEKGAALRLLSAVDGLRELADALRAKLLTLGDGEQPGAPEPKKQQTVEEFIAWRDEKLAEAAVKRAAENLPTMQADLGAMAAQKAHEAKWAERAARLAQTDSEDILRGATVVLPSNEVAPTFSTEPTVYTLSNEELEKRKAELLQAANVKLLPVNPPPNQEEA